jgi:hypothetical protein
MIFSYSGISDTILFGYNTDDYVTYTEVMKIHSFCLNLWIFSLREMKQLPFYLIIVGLATGYGLDGQVSAPGRSKISLFSTPSRPALEPTQPPIQ